MNRPAVALCPYCGGQTTHKKVERLLCGGQDAAVITVPADVCRQCGQHIYDWSTARKFEEIRRKLAAGDTAEFHCLGRHFQVVNADLPLTGITDRPNPPPFGRGRVVIPGKKPAAPVDPAGD